MTSNILGSRLTKKTFAMVATVGFFLLTTVFAIPSIVDAAPGGTPPGGNVDASFDSVTVAPGVAELQIKDGGGGDTEIESDGDILLNMNTGSGGLYFQNSGSSNGLMMNSSGIWDTVGSLNLVDNVDVQGYVTATGNMTGLYSYFSRFYDRYNTSYYLDLDSNSYVNNINGAYTYFYRFYDRNNTGFYVDPASTSYLNDVRGSIFYDREHTGYYLNPYGTSIMQYVRADRFYDRNNTIYYVDPASTSNMYRGEFINIDAGPASGTGSLEIGNTLRLDGNEVITNSNSTLYLQHDNNGDLRVDNTTLAVDSSANRVGIGKTAPTSTLDVNGNIRGTNIGYFYFRYGSSHNLKNLSDSCFMGSNPRICLLNTPACTSGDRAISVDGNSWGSAGADPKTYVFWTYLSTTTGYHYVAVNDTTQAPSSYSIKTLCFSPNG